jgi:hypothetical protein
MWLRVFSHFGTKQRSRVVNHAIVRKAAQTCAWAGKEFCYMRWIDSSKPGWSMVPAEKIVSALEEVLIEQVKIDAGRIKSEGRIQRQREAWAELSLMIRLYYGEGTALAGKDRSGGQELN